MKIKHFVECVTSPDDNGYYAEIFDKQGKSIYTTKVYKTKGKVLKDLMEYAHKHNFTFDII